jgi:hypothetical protein
MKRKVLSIILVVFLIGGSFSMYPPKAHAEDVFDFFNDVFDAVVTAIVPDFIYEVFYCDILNSFLPSCDSNGASSGNQTPNTANRAPESVLISPVSQQKFDDTNYSYVFRFLSTDPDGDEIRYEIDWDNNQSVDQSFPGDTRYVTSNVPQETTKLFSSAVDHTFLARATDDKGASSGWTNYSIQKVDTTLVNANPIYASCAISNPTDQRLISLNSPVTWTVVANGGDGNYRYLWDNATTPSISNTFTRIMTDRNDFAPTINAVIDSSSPQENTSSFSCPSASILPITCEVDNARPTVGTFATWTVKENGIETTNRDYTYAWSNGFTETITTTKTFSTRLDSVGSFTPILKVTDSSVSPSKTYTPVCTTITSINPNVPAPTMTFRAIPNSGSVASPVYNSAQSASTITVNVNQKFKLDWSITDALGCTPSSDSTSATQWLNQDLSNNPIASTTGLRITENTKYTVTCVSGQDGSNKSASVNVLINPTGTFQEF